MSNYRELSKQNWHNTNKNIGVTIEQINCGSLQRIADACEIMAKNYNDLFTEKEKYKRLYDAACTGNEYLYRRIAALNGVITKLKNKNNEKLNLK